MPKGKVFDCKTKLLILNVLAYFELEKENGGPVIPLARVQDRVAAAFKISVRSVQRLVHDDKQNIIVKSRKERLKPKSNDVCEGVKSKIRDVIYGLYASKIPFTLATLQKVLKEREIIQVCVQTLSKLLKSCGFKFKKECNRRYLCELAHIAHKRVVFLKNYVKNLELSERQLVFTDETWIFSKGQCRTSWQDDTPKSVRKPLGDGGKRFIILHAGTREGFISGASLIFSSKSNSADYHDNMDSENFENWVKEQLIPNLESPSLLVLDNASYHSRVVQKQPSSNWKKQEIKDWLDEHKIYYPQNSLRIELLQIAKQNRKEEKYVVDEMLREHGHETLRLPPYHCQFNPIELIWSNCKRYYDKHIGRDGYGDANVIAMWNEAVNQCSAQNWEDCINHTETLIKDWWKREKLFDTEDIAPLIITLSGDDNSSDEELFDGYYSDE